MNTYSKILYLGAIFVMLSSSECEFPLVDYDVAFFAKNHTTEDIVIYTGEGQLEDFSRSLPINRVVPYAPIPPGETGYIAVPTSSSDIFDELPDRIFRIWVFQDSIFNELSYDSIRQNPNLFQLITITEEEFRMMGDTLFIE
jgi:hypothetical protein